MCKFETKPCKTACYALKDHLSYGNNKLPKSTAIFNLGSATECPSKALGLCALADECYAMKAEKQYPACKPYRDRQLSYWNSVDADQFADEFLMAIKRKRTAITALRVNESGDFYSQADIEKLSAIADKLSVFGIKVYAYTARRDLNFNDLSDNLNIMGSFITAEQKISAFIGVKDAKAHAKNMRGFYNKTAVCPGDCKKCSLCQVVKSTVVFCEIH